VANTFNTSSYGPENYIMNGLYATTLARDYLWEIREYLLEKYAISIVLQLGFQSQGFYVVLKSPRRFYFEVLKPQLEYFSRSWGWTISYEYNFAKKLRRQKIIQVRVKYRSPRNERRNRTP